MMPSLSKVSNSSFAIFNFLGERRLAWQWTGKPVVGIWCRTPCFGKSKENVGIVSSGQLHSMFANSFVDFRDEMWNNSCTDWESLMVFRLSVQISRSFAWSTRRLYEHRKSPPMIGWVTSAIMKRHEYFWRPRLSIIWRVPNVLIWELLAAMREWLQVFSVSDWLGCQVDI